MNWSQALMAGFGDAAASVGSALQQRQQNEQKLELQRQQAIIDRQKEYTMAALRAPAEHTITVNDTASPSGKAAVVQQWVMPTQDGQPGSYKEISRSPVPINYEKVDNYEIGNGQAQTAFVNKDDPSKPPVLLGTPFPSSQSLKQKELGIQQARLGLEANGTNMIDTVAADGVTPIKKMVNSRTGAPVASFANPTPQGHGESSIPFEHVMQESTDEAGNVIKTPMRFDRRTGNLDPATASPTKPQNYVPDSPAWSPMQQFDTSRAPAGSTPQNNDTPMASGGGGSSPGMNPQASKGAMKAGGAGPTPAATAQGKPIRVRSPSTGKMGWKYPDGTVVQDNG